MLLGKDEKAVLITRALINVTETSIVTNRLQRRRIHPLVIPGQEAQARLRQVTTYGIPPFERRRHGQDTIREGKMEIMHGNRIGIVKQRIGYEESGVEGIVPCSNRGGFKRTLTIALEVVLRRIRSCNRAEGKNRTRRQKNRRGRRAHPERGCRGPRRSLARCTAAWKRHREEECRKREFRLRSTQSRTLCSRTRENQRK